MKNFFIYFLIISSLSACWKYEYDNEIALPENRVKINYKGRYEEVNGLSFQDEVYSNISVSQIVEQVNNNEEIELIQYLAKAGDTDNYILFKVYPDSTGPNALYNEYFSFRSQGATYYHCEYFHFDVLRNTENEFIAEFSGKLKHYNQYENYYFYMECRSGEVIYKW